MTEEERLTCSSPAKMLDYIDDKSTDRKLRLFACALCRKHWTLLIDNRSRRAVEVGEQFADGETSEQERAASFGLAISAWEEINGAAHYPMWNSHHLSAFNAACAVGKAVPSHSVSKNFTFAIMSALAFETYGDFCELTPDIRRFRNQKAAVERKSQAKLLRCIFNPFQTITLDPSWLTPTVTTLAQGIYEDRAFDRMPILADALQDADCSNEDILTHCRGPGPHVRGCFVVDLILQKQ